MDVLRGGANRTALIALAAAALGGFLIGRDATQGGGGHASHTRAAIVANVLIEYPQEWSRTTNAPLAGLSLSEATLFSPRGNAPRAGLLVGALAAGEAAPLPRSFVRALSAPARVAVVALAETQAYRYSGLRVAGYDGSMTAYAIPTPDERTTIAACYAPAGDDAFLARCGGVVAGATLLGQAQQGSTLTPDPAYARHLAAVLGDVEAARREVAATRAGGATPRTLAQLSGRLSEAYARAASALAALEPAPPATATQLGLVRALSAAASAYAALASTPAGAGAGSQQPLRARARAAEALVNEALVWFSLLGYGSASARSGAGAS